MKLHDQQTEERNRSQAISYAKDLVCADKVKHEALFDEATAIYHFVKGGDANPNNPVSSSIPSTTQPL